MEVITTDNFIGALGNEVAVCEGMGEEQEEMEEANEGEKE